jgi:hypothetical protein
MKAETLTTSARAVVESMTKQSEVYPVSVAGKAPDELVLVSFAIPEGADTNNYQIVEVNAQDSTVNYPAFSLVISEGLTYIRASVRNGSLCYLAMK